MAISPRELKADMTSGKKIVLGWCSIPSPVTAEIVARQGFDALAVDLQHGLMDYQTALSLLQVIDALGVPALCRVPWNEPGTIMKALDAGFIGVICPMVNTHDDAVRLASACRYAPKGTRSYGPTRAAMSLGSDYAAVANDVVLSFAMIETAEALQNLDDILSVDGIDGVYVGPGDLGLSLGFTPTLLPDAPEVVQAITDIRARAKARGKLTGIHCGSPAMVRRMLDEGFDLATLLTDLRLFTTIMSSQLAEARVHAAPPVAGQY